MIVRLTYAREGVITITRVRNLPSRTRLTESPSTPLHLSVMETAETFLPIFWVAFAPLVVLVLAIGAEWIGDQISR